MRILLIVVLLVLSACKQAPKSNQFIEKKEVNLECIINARVTVDDVFEVYFYEEGDLTFHPQDFVEAKVLGSLKPQEIKFTLPEHIIPLRIRLDMGKNINQEEITLYSVKLVYGDKEYIFTNELLVNGFKPSKYITINKTGGNIIFNTQELEGKYDPYFYSPKISNIVNYLMED